ncbi:MAG: EAL domain-containing protein [Rhodopseudomonas sp.]|nr:EAL domain-containing protein [Rhodopseudomonas sp.]
MSRRTATPHISTVEIAKPQPPLSTVDSSAFARALSVIKNYHPDRLMMAVAKAARELLHTTDVTVSLPAVLAEIGQAMAADRAHIILIDGHSEDGNIIRHHFWSSHNGAPVAADFKNAVEPMAHVGLKPWIPRLKGGETIQGHIRDFEPEVRKFLESGGIKSTLNVPISDNSEWFGFIAFDSCDRERDWSSEETETVETVAELMGAAISRAAHLKMLADAERIIEHSSTILYRLGPEPPYPLTFVSQNIDHFGFEPIDLLADPGRWVHLIDEADLPKLQADLTAITSGKIRSIRTEFRLRKPDGSVVWFDGIGDAVRDSENKVIGIEGIITDITQRKTSEEQLLFSNILLTTAMESSPDAIIVVNTDNVIVKSNQHFIDMWNVPLDVVRAGADRPALKHVAAQVKDEEQFLADIHYLYDHPEMQSHQEIETKDGRVIERHSDSLYDPQQKYLGRIWFFRDITEKKRAAEKMIALARTDALTGLANRAGFLERLNLEFARARRGDNRFAVHYLDLDHFKDVNDTLGHPVGDKLLRAVADRLRSCVRDTDLVARFGGDEFAVLQDGNVDNAGIEALAAKIAKTLAAPYPIEDSQVQTSASIGIVPYSDDVAGVDAIMMKADLALYRAKNEGRNQYRFHVSELDEKTRERMVISEELRHAIKRKEFELFFQPQVALKSGRIVGMEALIRWNHPQRGLILPGTFIPIAETTGSVVPIGEWVIEQACRQIKAWNDLKIAPLTIAINLSSAQFRLASHLDRIITDTLARYDVAPHQIEIELTESVLLETTQRHRDVFDRLRKIGIQLAIDDFGTGYSSLDYLRSFRVSRLKIDPSFIGDVETNADAAAIVRATIGLAHELGIKVVAEGVETPTQRDFLIATTCDYAQGFYFGKPLPAAAATDLLRQNYQVAAA